MDFAETAVPLPAWVRQFEESAATFDAHAAELLKEQLSGAPFAEMSAASASVLSPARWSSAIRAAPAELPGDLTAQPASSAPTAAAAPAAAIVAAVTATPAAAIPAAAAAAAAAEPATVVPVRQIPASSPVQKQIAARLDPYPPPPQHQPQPQRQLQPPTQPPQQQQRQKLSAPSTAAPAAKRQLPPQPLPPAASSMPPQRPQQLPKPSPIAASSSQPVTAQPPPMKTSRAVAALGDFNKPSQKRSAHIQPERSAGGAVRAPTRPPLSRGLTLSLRAQSISTMLRCGVCLELITACVATPCSHRFCAQCARDAYDAHNRGVPAKSRVPFSCPECRRELGEWVGVSR